MKLRTKTILAISVVSLFVFGALQVATLFVIQPSFKNLEIQVINTNVKQASSTIDYSLSQLTGKVKDYSFWDETYNFVQNQNQNYIDNNYVDETFQNLNLNLVVIVNNNRSIVYAQSFDLNNSAKISTSDETKSQLTSNNQIWNFSSSENATSGIMLVDNQPMLVATATILTSLNQGPSMGGLLFGKYIDPQEISQLTQIVNLNFSIDTLSDFRSQKSDNQIVDSLLSNEQTIIVKDYNPGVVSGFALIKDINSNPAFVLQVTQDRAAYQQGLWVINIIQAGGVAFIILLGAVVLFLLERNIVKPMTELATYVKEMPLNPNASKPIAKLHSEELSVLADAVKDTMKKKLEGMNEVSRMVGHDLRNPLTGIKGASYMLRKNYGAQMDEKGKNLFKTIDDCVDYSDKIVRDLLDYSCEIKLDKIITNPKRLVENSLATVAAPSNVQVVNQTSDEFSILVDNGRIERVFTNLIKNAFDAMPEGGQLKISSKKGSGVVEVDFSDNGVGMSNEVLERLWTPFFTTKAKGMGVGLSICKRIMEAHRGRIEVKSVPGKGTVFSVFLPLNNN